MDKNEIQEIARSHIFNSINKLSTGELELDNIILETVKLVNYIVGDNYLEELKSKSPYFYEIGIAKIKSGEIKKEQNDNLEDILETIEILPGFNFSDFIDFLDNLENLKSFINSPKLEITELKSLFINMKEKLLSNTSYGELDKFMKKYSLKEEEKLKDLLDKIFNEKYGKYIEIIDKISSLNEQIKDNFPDKIENYKILELKEKLNEIILKNEQLSKEKINSLFNEIDGVIEKLTFTKYLASQNSKNSLTYKEVERNIIEEIFGEDFDYEIFKNFYIDLLENREKKDNEEITIDSQKLKNMLTFLESPEIIENFIKYNLIIDPIKKEADFSDFSNSLWYTRIHIIGENKNGIISKLWKTIKLESFLLNLNMKPEFKKLNINSTDSSKSKKELLIMIYQYLGYSVKF